MSDKVGKSACGDGSSMVRIDGPQRGKSIEHEREAQRCRGSSDRSAVVPPIADRVIFVVAISMALTSHLWFHMLDITCLVSGLGGLSARCSWGASAVRPMQGEHGGRGSDPHHWRLLVRGLLFQLRRARQRAT